MLSFDAGSEKGAIGSISPTWHPLNHALTLSQPPRLRMELRGSDTESMCSPTEAALGGPSRATCRALVPDSDFSMRRAARSQLTYPRQVHPSSPELCQLINRCCPVPRGRRGRETNGLNYRWLAEPSPCSLFMRQACCSGLPLAGDALESGAAGLVKPGKMCCTGWGDQWC